MLILSNAFDKRGCLLATGKCTSTGKFRFLTSLNLNLAYFETFHVNATKTLWENNENSWFFKIWFQFFNLTWL